VDEIQMSDEIQVDSGSVRITNDGYMTAIARVARTGIQMYRGSEVGRPDLEWARVYRPENEVFAADSLRTYAHRPVTNDHPPVAVTADNWKQFSVGHIGDEVIRDGRFVKVPLTLMDKAAIEDFRRGKNQLSLGYGTQLRWEKGTAPDGQAYDAVQTVIRANHLAVVKTARGGSDLRLGDRATSSNHERNEDMNLVKLTVDSIDVQVTDVAAGVIQRHLQRMETQAAELRKKFEFEEEEAKKAKEDAKKAKDSADAIVATKDAEIATLKQQVADAAMTPAKLDDMVKSRHATATRAKAIIGDKLVVDGKSEADIRRQVVDAKLGDAAKGWSDDQVSASFNTLAASAPGTPASSGGQQHQLSTVLGDLATHVDTRDAAYAERNKNLNGAWRGHRPGAV
jgi:hypothetical protein